MCERGDWAALISHSKCFLRGNQSINQSCNTQYSCITIFFLSFIRYGVLRGGNLLGFLVASAVAFSYLRSVTTSFRPPALMSGSLRKSQRPMTPLVVDVAGSSFVIAGKCWSSFSVTASSGTDNELPPSTPVTVIETKGVTKLSSTWLQETVKGFLDRDDVFNEGFMPHLLFKTPSAEEVPSMADDMQPLLRFWGSTAHVLQSKDSIPSGPYVFFPSRICQVFRLFPDPQSAFMHGLVQTGDDSMR